MRPRAVWPVLAAMLALAWALAWGAMAPVPSLSARVTDLTQTLSPAQIAGLEARLQQFEAQRGTQIAVLIVSSTGDETIEQYGMRVAEAWKLGRRKTDDGALLLVAKDDRTLRIEVGYGLEGALNDAVCERIISEIMVPRLRAGDFYGAISDGAEKMIEVASGEALPPPAPLASLGGLEALAPVLLLVMLVAGSVLRALVGRLPAAVLAGGAAAVLAWLSVGVLLLAAGAGALVFLLVLLGGGSSHRGGWHSGGMGGAGGVGGFGGFGGGGFSGGGGGFGGGGASGRW